MDIDHVFGSMEEITYLSWPEKIAIVQHPNLPKDIFVEMCGYLYFYAKNNPALPLWLLEDPLFWENIERENIEKWLKEECKDLWPSQQTLFAADCVEHVLYLFDSSESINSPRLAIQTARNYFSNLASDAELQRARRDAWLDGKPQSTNPASAMVALAASCEDCYQALDMASDAKGYEADIDSSSEAFKEAKFREQQWQWNWFTTVYSKNINLRKNHG